jgi:anti-sigma factor ChrR (cupin superfamily)
MVTDQAGVGLVAVCPKCGQHVIVPQAVGSNPVPDANPSADSGPKNEKTVALKWTPPPVTPRVDPKK